MSTGHADPALADPAHAVPAHADPAHALVVAVLLVTAAILRFSGLNWDEGQWIHPDEGHMRAVTGAIRLPQSPGLYFDTHASSLNPRNNEQVYSYGTLPLFATRALAEWLDRGCGPAPAPLNRWVAHWLLQRATGMDVSACTVGTFTWTYNAFVGRHLSALADAGTVLLLYFIGRRLYNGATGLLAMGLGTLTAFMIQQAHFYTVDSAATFFTALTAYFATRGALSSRAGLPWLDFALAGLATGLATASKVSAAVAAGLVALAALAWALRPAHSHHTSQRNRRIALFSRAGRGCTPAGGTPSTPEPSAPLRAGSSAPGDAGDRTTGIRARLTSRLAVLLPLLLAALLALVAFRAGQPYAFEGPGFFGVRPNPDWFSRLRQIREEQIGVLDYPSGRQWTNRWPVVFPFVNIVVWGMGLPLGLAVFGSWVFTGWELVCRPHAGAPDGTRHGFHHLIPWAWATLYFLFYATRWVKAMRYFLPIYPMLLLLTAYALVRLVATAKGRCRPLSIALLAAVVLGAALWGNAMLGVYLRPHPRIAASRWIYDHVPGGSVVANEHWDWGLPLRVDGRDGFRGIGVEPAYTGIELALYDEDTPEKRAQLLAWLDRADYLFLASNRLYGSIPRLPERYPLTSAYYRALFAGELGFELMGAFTSYLQVGPFVFPDQETPFTLMEARHETQAGALSVPLPPAEESFSVYDHPNCLIFRKTPAYSHARAAAILGAVDLAAAQPGLSPHAATPRATVVAHEVAFTAGVVLVGLVVIRAGAGIWRGGDRRTACTRGPSSL